MKKNKSMRAAGGLMIATMLTTSIVSGTYAKYVTSGTAKDTARVAKFGVEVTAEGSLFDKNYLETANTPTDAGTGISVKSENSDNLVAPGTKSDNNGLSFSITGTPEVDVNVKIEVANTSASVLPLMLHPNQLLIPVPVKHPLEEPCRNKQYAHDNFP